MSSATLIFLLAIVLFAYLFKASTGFGSAIIMVAFASRLIGPVGAVVLVAILDVVAGSALVRLDWKDGHWFEGLPHIAVMATGTIFGSLLIPVLPAVNYNGILGGVVVVAGLWMIVRSPRTQEEATKHLHLAPKPLDLFVCGFGGLCGGLTSLSGPPIVAYFSPRLEKTAFRRLVTRLFLVEAVARVATYSMSGTLEWQIFRASLLAVPCLFVGLMIGDRVFRGLPQAWFTRLVGILVIAAGVKLMVP